MIKMLTTRYKKSVGTRIGTDYKIFMLVIRVLFLTKSCKIMKKNSPVYFKYHEELESIKNASLPLSAAVTRRRVIRHSNTESTFATLNRLHIRLKTRLCPPSPNPLLRVSLFKTEESKGRYFLRYHFGCRCRSISTRFSVREPLCNSQFSSRHSRSNNVRHLPPRSYLAIHRQLLGR